MSAGFARMQYVAGDRAYEVFGFFQKFLEIAASEYRDRRGKLLTHQGKAATADDLAFDLRAPLEQVKNALTILTSPQVAWLQEVTEIPAKIARSCKKLQDLQKSALTKRNETKQNLTKLTRARARAHAREEPSAEQAPISTIARADSSSTSTRQAVAQQMDALDLDKRLRDLLCPRGNSDYKALWNLEHWAMAQGPDLCERILTIAKDSGNGHKPIAVFFSRLDHDVGYRPRAEADKLK
jgi:hypothetical protein